MYFHQIRGLWAGRAVNSWNTHQISPKSSISWDRQDQILLIEEGRRQIDEQRSSLENLRGRGQYLLTLDIALSGLYATLLTTSIPLTSVWSFVVWFLGSVLLLLSTLGGTAVLVGSKTLGGVDAAKFSQSSSGQTAALADAYTASVGRGENTIATQITVFRDAVTLTLGSSFCLGFSWCLGVLVS